MRRERADAEAREAEARADRARAKALEREADERRRQEDIEHFKEEARQMLLKDEERDAEERR